MKEKLNVIRFFIFGIFFSTIVFSPFVLDFTLTPRFVFTALTLIISIVLVRKLAPTHCVKFDVLLFIYLVFVIFSCGSALWANTSSEAVFEACKLIISFALFSFCYYGFKQNFSKFLIMLCKLSLLIFSIELALVIYQLSQLTYFNKDALYSIYGINSHKNLVSSFLFLQLFFIIIGCIRLKTYLKFAFVIALILIVALIITLQTKAVWIGLIIALISFVIIKIFKKTKFNFNFKTSFIISMLIANLFFILFLPKIINKGINFNLSNTKTEIENKKIELDNERLLLWDKSYVMIKKHPLIGAGLGNWQIYFPDATLKSIWRAEDLNYTFQRPHNDFLWVLSETGLIGFNLYIAFIFAIILLLFKILKNSLLPKNEFLEISLCCAFLLGFYAVSFFDFPKERIEHLIWLSIILAFGFYFIKKHILLPIIFKIKFTKNTWLIPLFILLFVFIAGVYRYNGEWHTRRMYDAKSKNNYTTVINEGKKAMSFIYQIDPTSLPIKWYIGNANISLGNLNEAQTDLLSALNTNPFNRNVLNDVGSSYAKLNNEEFAINYYNKALRISPRFDDPKLNIIAIYLKHQQFSKADSCLKTLLHDSERRSSYQKMVNAFLNKN